MSTADHSAAARAGTYLDKAAVAAVTWYDSRGAWTVASKPPETRERLWIASALYRAEMRALADGVIRLGDTAQYGSARFNIFDTNIAAALLIWYRERMAADVRAKLESLVRDGFSFKPGNRQPDYQFHGYNDNMPAKATLGLILGGELLGVPDAVEYGLWNLRQFRAMLVRAGTNSEFNSPTYSPLTIHAMGEIAEHARHPEARQLAHLIEERLWIDMAARFHPETGVLAGPHSRAYTADTLAHASCASALLWFNLGDAARPSPMLLFERNSGLILHHMGDLPFNIAQMCWFASGTFHLPDAALRMFTAKEYPFHAVATSEQGDAGPDFPARPCRIETYLAEDFSVGTATTSMCGGEQTMTYFATYRRRKPVQSFRDVGTVFAKMVVNDNVPGLREHGRDEAGAYANEGEADMLASRANTIAYQSDATALVLTHPHLSLGGSADAHLQAAVNAAPALPLTSLSELVIFPAHSGGADELIVAGERRDAWTGAVARCAWVACRRGRLLIGVRSLAYTRTLGPVRLSLERINAYEVIRVQFYAGATRTFARGELRHVFGGFVAEHASVDEYASLEDFAVSLAAARFTDYFWTTRRVRYRRDASRVRPRLEMEVSWSPGSQIPRFAAINGQPVRMPILQIDGIANEAVPFLDQPYASVPSFFPWRDFRVEWGDWPYAIGDREE